MMTVLKVHNFYQQVGGEDRAMEAEIALLKSHGHRVVLYTVHNDAIKRMNPVHVAMRTLWSRESCREIRRLVETERPAVVHFHNTFPLISPGAYYAAREAGAAVVQTLHNYRLMCPNGLFYRDGRACEACLQKRFAWPAIGHRCYHGARGSATVAVMLALHRAMGTWRNAVDRYVVMTEFERGKFVEGGLPAEKMVVKPHFLSRDPGVGKGGGGYAVYVGRLSHEKGLDTLLEAWTREPGLGLGLKIIGDGPLNEMVSKAAAEHRRIEWLGRMPMAELEKVVSEAEFLISPSGCYETFGRVAIEAFAVGTPVLTSTVGATAELVEVGRTGLHFANGDANDLATKARELMADPERLSQMRQAARAEFELRYTAERNYPMIMGVFESAMGQRGARRAAAA